MSKHAQKSFPHKNQTNGAHQSPQAHQVLESMNEGVFVVGTDFRVQLLNRAGAKSLGVEQKDATNKFCSEVFRSSWCGEQCPVAQAFREKKSISNRRGYFLDFQGERVPVIISAGLIYDIRGEITGAVESFRFAEDADASRGTHTRPGKEVSLEDYASSSSPLMQKIASVLPGISHASSTVLITGESGTGKEVLAQTIHRLSGRSGTFTAINCGALPDDLLEAEMFGYQKGAFTGAVRDHSGLLQDSANGTLFLDEVAEMSEAMQLKLLRVLQEREYRPLGSTTVQKLSTRILAATHRNLQERVQQGMFRQDLFFRINVVELQLPGLRERLADIPRIAGALLPRVSERACCSSAEITPAGMQWLQQQSWPGNIRELENLLERALLFFPSGVLGEMELMQASQGFSIDIAEDFPTAAIPEVTAQDHRSRVERAEYDLILETLQKNQNNKTATARELGMHKSTLFRKLKRLCDPHLQKCD